MYCFLSQGVNSLYEVFIDTTNTVITSTFILVPSAGMGETMVEVRVRDSALVDYESETKEYTLMVSDFDLNVNLHLNLDSISVSVSNSKTTVVYPPNCTACLRFILGMVQAVIGLLFPYSLGLIHSGTGPRFT